LEAAPDEGPRLESVELDAIFIASAVTVDEAGWNEDWRRPFTRARLC